jgi:effector-binding domain-containing protein
MSRAKVGVFAGISFFVCAALVAVSLAEEKKTAAAAEAKGPDVGEVRIRTMAPVTYVYVETETTFDKLGEVIGEVIPQLAKAAEDGKFRLNAPFVMTYPQGSAHLTPDKPFKVQIGLKAEGEAAASGNVKVRTTEEFRAATVLYTGPPAGIGGCYEKLMPAIREMGLELSGEEREYTLYWEGLDSPNNVCLVQVGIKEKK